jgi:hypothetical protein
MKITASPTEHVVQTKQLRIPGAHPDAQQCRVWHAETESGIPFLMYVVRVAVPAGMNQAEFERELQAMPAPIETEFGKTLQAFRARHVI